MSIPDNFPGIDILRAMAACPDWLETPGERSAVIEAMRGAVHNPVSARLMVAMWALQAAIESGSDSADKPLVGHILEMDDDGVSGPVDRVDAPDCMMAATDLLAAASRRDTATTMALLDRPLEDVIGAGLIVGGYLAQFLEAEPRGVAGQ